MSVAQLAHPEWFGVVMGCLIGVAAALIFARWRGARRHRLLLGATRGETPSGLKLDAVLWVALAAIGVALLGPRIGQRSVEMNASGVDLVILVDVSRSMDAPDNPPSRLDRARRGIAEMLARLEPNDRVALAAFAGRGVLLSPLTPDHAALVELAAALDTHLIHPASSDLDAGIRAAVTAFETGSQRPRAISVFSDGEDPRQRDPVGVPAALAAQVRVVSVAFGGETGSAIPDGDVPLRDRSGQVVVTRRHSQRLARLSDATGGVAFAADRWGVFDFDAVTREVRREAVGDGGARVERQIAAIRVLPFAALAFALLLVEGLPRPSAVGQRQDRSRIGRRLTSAGLVLLLLGASESEPTPEPERFEAALRDRPRDPRMLYGLGRARLAAGDAAAAATAFAAASVYARDPKVVAASHFARGVSELERGEMLRARDAFFDALAFDPQDRRARFNLEWTLVALQREPPPPETEDRPAPPSAPDRERPEPDPEPDLEENEPSLASEAEPPEPSPALSDAQQRRALARVTDDLAPALRAAARSGAAPERDRGPAW